MTEQEQQLVLLDGGALLRHLEGKVGDRKLRLLAAASGRAVWRWLGDERSRRGVALLEQLADKLIVPEERIVAAVAAQAAADEVETRWDQAETREQVVEFGIRWWAATASAEGLGERAFWGALEALGSAGMATDWAASPSHAAGPGNWAGMPMGEWEAALALEVFGNPFRPVTVPPKWLTPTVVSVAHSMYAEQAFDRMPILADALEEASCDQPDILGHLRGGGEHVRGCWAIDLLLGKE